MSLHFYIDGCHFRDLSHVRTMKLCFGSQKYCFLVSNAIFMDFCSDYDGFSYYRKIYGQNLMMKISQNCCTSCLLHHIQILLIISLIFEAVLAIQVNLPQSWT